MDEQTQMAYGISSSNIEKYKEYNRMYIFNVYEQYAKKEAKLGMFFPLNSTSYMCKGYLKRIDTGYEWDYEKLFLVMNHKIFSISNILFNINDILKLFYDPDINPYLRRLIIEADKKIDYNSEEWDGIRFVIDLSNMEFSGTFYYMYGKFNFYDLKYVKYGVVRRCELICNMNRIDNTLSERRYIEEFMIQQFHQDSFRMKVISTKRIENYYYYPEYSTILQNMIAYLKQVALNTDITWGWYSEDKNYEEKEEKRIEEEKAKNVSKKSTSDKEIEWWSGKYRIITREEIDRNGYGSNFSTNFTGIMTR